MNGAFAISFWFWLMLTGDLSLANIAVGLAGSLVVSRFSVHHITVVDYAIFAVKILKTLPKAFAQALVMMVLWHRYEVYWKQPLAEGLGPWKLFGEVFLITLTPKSIALGTDEHGQLDVHDVARRKNT